MASPSSTRSTCSSRWRSDPADPETLGHRGQGDARRHEPRPRDGRRSGRQHGVHGDRRPRRAGAHPDEQRVQALRLGDRRAGLRLRPPEPRLGLRRARPHQRPGAGEARLSHRHPRRGAEGRALPRRVRRRRRRDAAAGPRPASYAASRPGASRCRPRSTRRAGGSKATLLAIEEGTPPDVVAALRGAGFADAGSIGNIAGRSDFGGAQFVVRDADGTLTGASDKRKDGMALGR